MPKRSEYINPNLIVSLTLSIAPLPQFCASNGINPLPISFAGENSSELILLPIAKAATA